MPKTFYGNTIKHRLHTAVSLRPLYLLIFYVHAQYLRAERFCSWCLWNEISLLPFVSQNQSCGGVIRTKSSWVYSEQRPFTFVYTPVISSKDISCGEFRVIMYQIRLNSVIHLLFFIVYLVCWSACAVKSWTLCVIIEPLHCLSQHPCIATGIKWLYRPIMWLFLTDICHRMNILLTFVLTVVDGCCIMTTIVANLVCCFTFRAAIPVELPSVGTVSAFPASGWFT